MHNATVTLLPEMVISSRREFGRGTKGKGAMRIVRDPKPDLSLLRYREADVPSTWSPGTHFCVQPLYAPRIPQFFTRRERAVLTPVESVSIEVRRSNGRLDTFSSATPFGQIEPGYVYGIFTSVHPVGVKGLASWRRTVVQSAREPHLFLGRTAREKPAERRRTE